MASDKRGMPSVNCGIASGKRGITSGERGMLSDKCGMLSAGCGMLSAGCGMTLNSAEEGSIQFYLLNLHLTAISNACKINTNHCLTGI
jgi:hypothetical protein